MQHFTDLQVWQRGRALAVRIYRLTQSYPDHERFGLVSQLRRAAASVPTNIAEGFRREHASDFARFLNIAEASLAEVESLILLSRDVGHVAATVADPILSEIGELTRMFYALRRRLTRL